MRPRPTASCTVAHDPPPPPRVRAVKRSSGIPAQRMTDSSSFTSMAKVTAPSMSAGLRPASATAAATASPASCSSLRPECLENSVWPMPTMAVSRASALTATTARPELGEDDAVDRLDAQRDLHPVARRRRHRCRAGWRRSGCRRPARRGPRCGARRRAWSGGARRSRCRRDPCPDDSCVSHSTEWHSPHIGAGGWRRVPHAAHRWKTRRPSAMASQKNWSSRVGDGGITAGHVMRSSPGRCRRRPACRCGRRRSRAR